MADRSPATSLLGSFPVAGVERVVRRTLMSAALVGLFGVVTSITLGAPLIAPGIVVGLVMAVVNHRVFQSTAMRFTDTEGAVRRKPFVGSVLLRLGSCTLVAVALLIWVRPMGFGVIAGLAIFQATMLFNAIVALVGYQRAGVEVGP